MDGRVVVWYRNSGVLGPMHLSLHLRNKRIVTLRLGPEEGIVEVSKLTSLVITGLMTRRIPICMRIQVVGLELDGKKFVAISGLMTPGQYEQVAKRFRKEILEPIWRQWRPFDIETDFIEIPEDRQQDFLQ